MYDSFDQLLQAAIREYYGRIDKNKVRFAALLITSGEAVPMAVEALRQTITPQRIAAGALGALLLRAALKWALAGPLGVVVTGLTLASLIAFYFSHQQEIWDEVTHTRAVVERTRKEYEAIRARFAAGRFTAEELELMLDGLLQRFLRELERPAQVNLEVVSQ